MKRDPATPSGAVIRIQSPRNRISWPPDGRAVLVSLTPHGRKLTDQCTAEISCRITTLTDHLTPTQRTQLTRLATALVRRAGADGAGGQGPVVAGAAG